MVPRYSQKRKAKVKWKDVFLPKNEGGLRIKSLSEWNSALISTHIWRPIPQKIPYGSVGSTLISLQVVIFGTLILSQIPVGAELVSTRMIYQEGYDPTYSIKDMVLENNIAWPNSWLSRFPQLSSISVPDLSLVPDVIKWRDTDGNLQDFSVHLVWEYYRSKSNQVPWASVIWFLNNIPKHAFVMWLLMGENLMTQDKLKHWEISDNQSLLCTLSEQVSDSHDHLFFNCPFSLQCVAGEKQSLVQEEKKKSVDQVYKDIYATVRLKLMTINWKKTPQSLRLKSDWKIS
ncbi:uncharacterized protein [Rutidosis leptorrhynchoides]|uniref:uncharacterized protein n=1 Tax=Rutidosis leptorrhynchoides TaxID=125765 RepID=UPI003A9915BF